MDGTGRMFLRLGPALHHVRIEGARGRRGGDLRHLGAANAFIDRIVDDAKRIVR